ncbi:hypothetical protein BG09_0758 [Bacillus thuringiensis serovar kurstaki str. HD-1]|nr:hypothetical protein HD73_0495 [Bacillus thuringiensis serovar kurstaki str. HD73]KEH50511.1 hypothetical protein BG09_0758 [Bacillus thuringiensis serovar kurstaki str. HD-1]
MDDFFMLSPFFMYEKEEYFVGNEKHHKDHTWFLLYVICES